MSDPFGELIKKTDSIIRTLRRLADELERVKSKCDFTPIIDVYAADNKIYPATGIYYAYWENFGISTECYENKFKLVINDPLYPDKKLMYIEGICGD